MPEHVELKTQNGVVIIGDYYAPVPLAGGSTLARGLLLLHMMPATRSSWLAFAEKAQAGGFHVLAIDLRGHGESQGGPDGYKNFNDAEHQNSKFDAKAGVRFLKSKGACQIYLGGASIGANLALQYLVDPPANGLEAKAAFLLSPGLDYMGLKTEPLILRVHPQQAVYFAASREDMRSSGQSGVDMADILYNSCQCRKEMNKFDGTGHGTTIFEREPAFMDIIISWLKGL